ncbi:MAG: peptidoglycan DD-metalloendopeptidase family protein [Alphaproteobacteria bacterium]|nr:peptidoglycan DD-metalloendopeptidase family protein [Alphaproteobacteria bacterium]
MSPRALLALWWLGVAVAQSPGDDPGVTTEDIEADPRRELARAESEERKVLQEMNGLEQQLFEVEREILDLRSRVDEIEQQRLLHEDELARAQAELDRQSESVGRLVRDLYRLKTRSFARVIFSAEDPAALRRAARYLISILRAAEVEARRFRDQVELKEAAVGRVDADREALAALMAELRLTEARLRDDRARREALLRDIRGRRSLALQVLAERNESARQLSQRLSATEGGYSGGVSFPSLHGKLRWPVSGGSLLRGFGPYTDPATGTAARSLGLDINAPRHTPIRSVADGTVTFQQFVPGLGLTIVVSHGDYASVYSHCGAVRVRKGQSVTRDQVIGTVGETGVTDNLGPRVHFEIRYHNTPQDPMPWLSSRSL